MTTIFKAVPGHKVIHIECLNESLRFMGNDVESIVVKDIHGGNLIIEEGDSLKEIIIERQRGIISFNRFPRNTIKIKGGIQEISVKDKSNFYTLHRYASHPTLPMSEINGAIITTDVGVDTKGFDALIIKTKEIKQIKFEKDLSHIHVIADSELHEVEINARRIVRSLVVQDGENLSRLEVNCRVLTCSVIRCQSVRTITGFGDRLIVSPKPRIPTNFSIGGFWYKIPDWYDERVSLLRLSQFDGHLTAGNLRTCSDLNGIKITPKKYEGRGGQIDFSYEFDLDIGDVAAGIDVIHIIDIIEKKGTLALEALYAWSENTLDWFDHYKAMRVIASLASRGYNIIEINKFRDRLKVLNPKIPKPVSGSVSGDNFGVRWRSQYSEDSNEWEIPLSSIMPFLRLDLEIWLHTSRQIESLGLMDDTGYVNLYILGGHSSNRKKIITNLTAISLSAANTSGRSKKAENKLTKLIEDLFSDPMVINDEYCCEILIPNLITRRLNRKEIVNALIKGISSMKKSVWVKAALLIGIVDVTNSINARMTLKCLASSRDLTVEESIEINAVAIAGKRAFETGKARKPTWPYVRHWQNLRRKIGRF